MTGRSPASARGAPGLAPPPQCSRHKLAAAAPRLTWSALPAWLRARRQAWHANYLAMYSSWYRGIVTEPLLMLAPMDDHMVHRGDAVFEAFKCVAGALYNLDAHLTRLAQSAAAIGIRYPVAPATLTRLIKATARAGGQRDCIIRLYLARGPGSFAANPDDCRESQLYIVATRFLPPFMERFPAGARIKISPVPVKPSLFATVKSCNYLPNVLMVKAAHAAGVHLGIGFDERGHLTESATENVGLVTRARRLLFPKLDRILKGTTMIRVMELARRLIPAGDLKQVRFADITVADLKHAAEILVCGTTMDVTAAVEFDGRPVGDGRPGPVFRRLSALLQDDIYHNRARRTPVFG